MNNKIIYKIKSKYTLRNIFDYISVNKTIKIVKYSKKIIRDLDYTMKDFQYFLFLKKIVKPICNCEDYLPITRRILSHNALNNKNGSFSFFYDNSHSLDLFCKYLNKNNKFIPQINKINGNENLLNLLNVFKIGFNQQFINNFYDDKKKLDLNKLSEFCKKYGNKIKEITFTDNNIPIDEINETYLIIKYIIQNSKIEKVEDRRHNSDKSILTKLYLENNDLNIGENNQRFIEVILKYGNNW